MKAHVRYRFGRALILALAALLAPVPAWAQEQAPGDIPETGQDPLEGFNRAMFAVHEGIDLALLKPAAQGYEAVVPLPARVGISNFYDNLWEISRSGNAFLQGKGQKGLTSLGRLLVNSTVGIFGLFDVAGKMGLEEGDEDFDQTLAVWGVPGGPYIFLPLIGPSTMRGLAGWSLDQAAYPLWAQVNDHPALRNGLVVLNVVKMRAALLPADQVIEDAAFDKYTYIRSAYLQRRAAQIRD
ncbi:MAG: VacJ family lipoprotein [Zoogloeaceae bacterium]|jgi:phospholipid-binding lipoprotein MlaA|nr:VacJ family lipoprotein [Zoogloeaceae bacterium]